MVITELAIPHFSLIDSLVLIMVFDLPPPCFRVANNVAECTARIFLSPFSNRLQDNAISASLLIIVIVQVERELRKKKHQIAYLKNTLERWKYFVNIYSDT